MKKPKRFFEKLTELQRVSVTLNRLLESGSFYELSFLSRYKWIRRVKKLYNGLIGPVSDFKLRHILAAAAVVVLGTGCPPPDGTITPSFAAPVTNPFTLVNIGNSAYPCFVDIDNDGDLDAFIGEAFGNTFYFENTGTASAPVFDAPVTNPFNLTDVGLLASPCFVDIDNDGDLDAFIGEAFGNTFYFENTGTASAPSFDAPVTNPFNLTDINFYASPCLVDIDNDGDLDAFIGEAFGNTFYFENTTL